MSVWVDTIKRALSALAPAPIADPITVKIPDPNYDPATQRRQEVVETVVDGLDAAKQVAVWLTKGVNHNQPATAVLLKDCTTDHLKNIIFNKPNLSADYKRVIESLLTDRGETLPVVPPPSIASAVVPRNPSDPVSDLNQIT